MKKYFVWGLALILLPFISADLIVPLTFEMKDLFPLVIVVEFIAFWLLTNKLFNIKLNFWKSLLIIVVANLVTSVIGLFISISILSAGIAVAYVLSIIFEFGIYWLFLAGPKIKTITLFWISLLVNFVSYLLIFLILYFNLF